MLGRHVRWIGNDLPLRILDDRLAFAGLRRKRDGVCQLNFQPVRACPPGDVVMRFDNKQGSPFLNTHDVEQLLSDFMGGLDDLVKRLLQIRHVASDADARNIPAKLRFP